MFSKILIANRGEIAVRIIKTCRRMGLATAIVYSEADADSLAVEMADEAVFIGAAPAAQSYLDSAKIIDACRRTGAEAVHPGFGFLSENATFARALEADGIVFIGPNPHAIEAMGDKIQSKKFAQKAGVSTVPGHVGEIEDVAHALTIAGEIGYPVMIKASAGGGGKGIRVAWKPRDVEEGLPAVRAEAKTSFGDDRIFIEKFIESPRHVEIQVLGDKHGHVVHLFERECSIQRRNQKVIEEAPSPLLDAKTRKAMGEQAIALARAVGYDSAGTVEFVAGQDRSFFFLEMNTRLQVEHPVTELITGVDLVEQMIRVAAGEPLPFTQSDLKISGWAIESRIYAEDPYRGFLPSIGRLVRYHPPQEGEAGQAVVRNDAGVREGDEISIFYDPMISKLSTWAPTRDAAIEAMGEALESFHIEGLGHNIPFLSAVMDQDRFRSGELSTSYIADEFPEGFHGVRPTAFQRDLMTAVACAMHRTLTARAAPQLLRQDWVVIENGDKRLARVAAGGGALTVEFLEDARTLRLEAVDWRPGRPTFSGILDGRRFTAQVRPAAEGFVIRHRAAQARVLVLSPRSAELHEKLPPKMAADTSKMVLSPMPGLVVSIDVREGQEVRAGEAVAIIEAMKMQNIIRAERDGVVKAVSASAGDSVAADEVLVEFA
ncbi:MAG TPA: acetyl/propionyl/methylcrotonyl-CoA carboxylase subunit alpha [Phenylobacterium sp.]|uniref:acetyl/propionyl/methylcrotonyl-CoA carboxylase subunit alpha n=1 Tax=Phenylobacterium sp. TaxID=1871053 RepID=UPI002BAC58DA|nr:acetyl/propionyl/methylcrotonyl-CoA carboxylase subunit alpha [Phenylobacterium sp.]HSV03133.1 acetyl/propionyl/methylcrotonyl-CoA carboxylase subunit alpha [Phenylobacterium sp.]